MAVVDIHIKNFLKKCGYKIDQMSYEEIENVFMSIADFLGISAIDLDLEIWNASRRGNKEEVEESEAE